MLRLVSSCLCSQQSGRNVTSTSQSASDRQDWNESSTKQQRIGHAPSPLSPPPLYSTPLWTGTALQDTWVQFKQCNDPLNALNASQKMFVFIFFLYFSFLQRNRHRCMKRSQSPTSCHLLSHAHHLSITPPPPPLQHTHTRMFNDGAFRCCLSHVSMKSGPKQKCIYFVFATHVV